MSIANHRRRLERLQKAATPRRDEWLEAVYASDLRDRAIRAMVALARALAGTDEIRATTPILPAPEAKPEPTACVAPAPPGEVAGRWSRTNRPGPRDVITREEYNQLVRWQWEDDHPERPAPSSPHVPKPEEPPQGEQE